MASSSMLQARRSTSRTAHAIFFIYLILGERAIVAMRVGQLKHQSKTPARVQPAASRPMSASSSANLPQQEASDRYNSRVERARRGNRAHHANTWSGRKVQLQSEQAVQQRMGELDEIVLSPARRCRNPARYEAECETWRHLCPGSSVQPAEFDNFMLEWCPATCGFCNTTKESDTMEEDTEIMHMSWRSSVNKTKCTGTMVSRRRNSGSNCYCRRRSGTKGLSVGWVCDEKANFIVYEGVKKLDQNTVCCCKKQQCSYESIRRGDVAHVSDNTTQWCCKLKEAGWFGGCPKNSGYNVQQNLSKCKAPKMEPTVGTCSNRLLQWLSDPSWYKTVSGWEYNEDAYSSYIPCMTAPDVHVWTIMLGVRNALAHVSMLNPIRAFIVSQPECEGLSGPELIQSATSSYEELCPFGMPRQSYKPDLVHEGTCSYDPLDKTIDLQESRMCAEGHRCACPIFDKGSEVAKSAYDAYATYSVFYSISAGSKAVATHASGLTAMVGVIDVAAITTAAGAVAAVAAPVAAAFATFAWPLTIGLGVIGLVAFSGSFIWKAVRHTCSRNVGCYPMDCVEEPGRGCRIRAPEDLGDERNPFWFMPPPTYKCAYKLGKCKLTQCSKENLWNQTIGVRATRSFRKKERTQVYNCQPMLHTDMSARQREKFETITADLKEEYNTAQRRNDRMRRSLEEFCPWSRPTKDNVLRCKGYTSCQASYGKQSCCDKSGGILQCPENFPLMCNDGYCGNADDLCKERGGVRPCPQATTCSWMLPSPAVGFAQCQDGNYTEVGWFKKSKCGKNGHGGIKRCPWEKPVMCNKRACHGDYCCVKTASDCDQMGGPRQCRPLDSYDFYRSKPHTTSEAPAEEHSDLLASTTSGGENSTPSSEP